MYILRKLGVYLTKSTSTHGKEFYTKLYVMWACRLLLKFKGIAGMQVKVTIQCYTSVSLNCLKEIRDVKANV